LAGIGLVLVLMLYPFVVLGLALSSAGAAVLAARVLGLTRLARAAAAGTFVIVLLAIVGVDAPWLIVLVLAVPFIVRGASRIGPGPIPLPRLVVIAAAFLVSLVVFPGDFLLWERIYRFVPGASAVRAVARVGLMTLIPASLGLAVAFDRLAPRRPVLTALLGVVCLLEQAVTTASFDKDTERRAIASLAARIEGGCVAFFYSPEGVLEGYQRDQLDGMWASLARRVPTVNGYSGHYPPGWLPLVQTNRPGDSGRRQVAAVLARWVEAHGLRPGDICFIRTARRVEPPP
jgi:hypothetical protein